MCGGRRNFKQVTSFSERCTSNGGNMPRHQQQLNNVAGDAGAQNCEAFHVFPSLHPDALNSPTSTFASTPRDGGAGVEGDGRNQNDKESICFHSRSTHSSGVPHSLPFSHRPLLSGIRIRFIWEKNGRDCLVDLTRFPSPHKCVLSNLSVTCAEF